ncbi:MAG: ATP cone domain-containing protein [Planctomycetota bacterium]
MAVPPRWVKKEDGRIEPFDESRIARAVLRAGRNAGREAEVERLAREMARSVTLFLAKQEERTPRTALIARALEAALSETRHESIANAAREFRDWRRRRSSEVRVHAPRADASSPVEVLSHGGAHPWSKRRIVDVLVEKAELARESAEDVARAVEERVFAAGLNQISTTLLRELIDAELFERGFSAQVGRLEVVGLPKEDLKRLTFVAQAGSPIAIEDQITRATLTRFALDELVGNSAAVAHRRGDLHLIGLGRPYRPAASGVCVQALVDATAPARASDVVRRLIGVCKTAHRSYESSFALVNVERGLASLVDAADLQTVLELLLAAITAPESEDLRPSPECLLAVNLAPEAPAEQRVVDLLLELFQALGAEAHGVRLVLRYAGRADGDARERLLRAFELARGGSRCDVVLGAHPGPTSRGLIPEVVALQTAILNLAGIALAAGRGERERFSLGIRSAVEAALTAFHNRRRRGFATWVRPAVPLFGRAAQEPSVRPLDHQRLTDCLGIAGLDAALRYLTGMGPTENPRVAELAQEVHGEVRTLAAQVGARLGLGQVVVEDVPNGDVGISLASKDLARYRDAAELLDGSPDWDTGVRLAPKEGEPLGADLLLRLGLADAGGSALYLARPVLAAAKDPEGLTEQILSYFAG